MKQELDELLCTTYPKLFADRNKPMNETAMCWGFCCGDGWFNIINLLCDNIQHHIDWNNKNFEKGYTQYKQVPQVTVKQVKEKFGTLSFYYEGGDEHISGMVRMAESISGVTCEVCGGLGERGGNGWITTLCKQHRDEREAKRAKELEEYQVEQQERERSKIMKAEGFEE